MALTPAGGPSEDSVTTTYGYDRLGRVTSAAHSDASAALSVCRASGNSLVLASRNSLVVRGVVATGLGVGWPVAAG